MVQVERKISLLHRSRIDIIANILASADAGAKKTHIMYKCNLSFKQLHVYLNYLNERELLTISPAHSTDKTDTITYETTQKGRDFIRAYKSIRTLLST